MWPGLKINEARPNDKLPYRGAWLWVGSQMIHLMELPNPDPLTGRPQHGGRDRHTCVEIRNVSKLKEILDKHGNTPPLDLSFTEIKWKILKALFAIDKAFSQDSDANALEFAEF